MNLAVGHRLGPYEIVSPLGAGGMGEVWRARDPRLGRDVAVKVLPPAFAADPTRVARFEREAKLLASLTHPNVATLYGVETVDGCSVLVLELVEGEDLAQRLKRGPIPLDEALPIARQVAEALEAAHQRGIVHRDLKPANVKLTPDGRVKVLDFGLAKAWRDDGPPAADADSRSPTLDHSGTAAGVILGTAAYMAPEQARGKPVDRRADVWAFGVLLHEMLSGRRLFAGESVSDTLAAVLERKIDLSALPAATPASVRRVLRRCLVRDPRQRLHDVADARIELEDADEPVATAPPPPRSSLVSRALPWAVAAVAIGLAAVLLLRPHPPAPPVPPPVRFVVSPGTAGSFESYPALSPDGRSLAYVFSPEKGATTSLWLHSFEQGSARPLPGTEDADQPFWSPDGRFLAFYAAGELRKIEVASGVVQTICPMPDLRGGTWGSRGDILFGTGPGSGLRRVRESGGPVETVTDIDTSRHEQSHRFPTFLPDGRHFVFSILGDPSTGGLYFGDLQGGAHRRLTEDIWGARYDARGYLVFLGTGALVAQSIDPERGLLGGDAFPLNAGRPGINFQVGGESWFSAASGAVAYRPGAATSRLVWVGRDGAELAEVASEGPYREPSLSRDGRRVVIEKFADGPRIDLWVFDTGRRDHGQRLTLEAQNAFGGVWSPDGRWVVYHARGGGAAGGTLARRAVDGAAAEEVLVSGGRERFPSDWSPDGGTILFEQVGSSTRNDVWTLDVAPPHAVRPVLQGASDETQPRFSPDGRLLSYTSDETGRPEVFVQSYPPTGAKWQVTKTGGSQASWRGDGREIYYLGGDRFLYAVPVRSFEPLVLGTAVPLFRPRVRRTPYTAIRTHYQVAPDGRRFLVAASAADPAESRIEVLLNWSPPASPR